MKYMVVFPLTKDTFKARAARFLDNGGHPPEGVTMLGRWHALGGDEVFVLAETRRSKDALQMGDRLGRFDRL